MKKLLILLLLLAGCASSQYTTSLEKLRQREREICEEHGASAVFEKLPESDKELIRAECARGYWQGVLAATE